MMQESKIIVPEQRRRSDYDYLFLVLFKVNGEEKIELTPGKLIDKVFNTDGRNEESYIKAKLHESATEEVASITIGNDAKVPKPTKAVEEEIIAETNQHPLTTVAGANTSATGIDNNTPPPNDEDSKPKQKGVYLNLTLLEKVIDGSNADTITKWLKLCGVKPKSKAKANQKRLQLTNKIETILSENDQVPGALTKAFIQKLYDKDVTAELLRLEVPLVKLAR